LPWALAPWPSPLPPAWSSAASKNAETGEFVYNAQVKLGSLAATATDQFGAYRFDNVPVGETSVRVVYNGMVAAAVTVQVVEGRETVADVALRSIDAPTQLDAFQVNVSRQMSGIDLAVNSSAISSNIKSVISSEQMGFIGDGNVAAALKFLPGIDLEMDKDGMANSVTMSGAPSANVPVTFGGFAVTTSADATVASSIAPQRSASLSQLSLNNISRVEINRSPLPDDPGSALAGSINFVPKSAFELSKPQYTAQVFGAVQQNKVGTTRMFGPWSSRISSYLPGAVLSAIVPVNDRFGFSVTLSTNQAPHSYQMTVMGWKSNFRATTNSYVDTPANPQHYMLNSFELDNSLTTTQRSSVNLTADYRLSKGVGALRDVHAKFQQGAAGPAATHLGQHRLAEPDDLVVDHDLQRAAEQFAGAHPEQHSTPTRSIPRIGS
jgi:hypothetical protein